MTYAIDQAGLSLIEEFEGFLGTKYWDPYGKVWTIGFGTTTDFLPNMPETCTRAQAQVWLQEFVDQESIPAIEDAAAAGKVLLNQNQVDALCSFTYNLGSGSLGPDWQIGAALRRGDLGAVGDLFTEESYETSGGEVLPGLVNRRKAEQALFRKPAVPPVPKPQPPTVMEEIVISAFTDGKGVVHIVQELSNGDVYHIRQEKANGAWEKSSTLVLSKGKAA